MIRSFNSLENMSSVPDQRRVQGKASYTQDRYAPPYSPISAILESCVNADHCLCNEGHRQEGARRGWWLSMVRERAGEANLRDSWWAEAQDGAAPSRPA